MTEADGNDGRSPEGSDGRGEGGRRAGASGASAAPDEGSEGRVVTRGRTPLSDGWARLESVRFDYRRADGTVESQTREVYHRGHGVAILLHDLARRRVVLVRQLRYPAHEATGRGFLLEVPAGVLEDDDPVATVVAEAEQETGYRVGVPEFLFAAYVSPGSITERIHFFAAPFAPDTRVGVGGGLADEGEDIEIVELDIDDALAGIRDGRIEDMKTIVLLQHAALHVFAPR